MNRHWRGTLLGLLMLGTIVLTTAGFTLPSGVSAADMPRVRSSSSIIRGLIDDAIAGSPTFRKLVTAIGATDGIVYVEQGPCYRGVRACLSMWVTRGAGFRFLRILVDLRGVSTAGDRVQLVGTIGHELAHALEVLADRRLTTTAAIFQFYAREFPTSGNTFETAAAVSMGNRIRREAGNWLGRPVTVVRHTWRDQCAGPETTLGTDGWWAWPCT